MSDDRDKCVILMPVGGGIEPRCDSALRELESRGYEVRRVYGFSAIDQGRSQIATDALKDGFEELMWIDSDVVFHPDDVDKIRAHDLPLCCAVYPKKGTRAFAFNFTKETRAVKFGKAGGLLEIRSAGFGFMHTRRGVYEAIVREHELPECNKRYGESMTPYFLPMVVRDGEYNDYLAEDFAFCERAKSSGTKIVADTSIRLFHVGSYPYGWEDAGADQKRYADYTFNIW